MMFRFAPLFLVALLSLNATAATHKLKLYVPDLLPAGSGPSTPVTGGTVEASAAAIDFGLVFVGDVGTKGSALLNKSSAPVTVSSVSTSGPFRASHNCATVAASDNCAAIVTFEPTSDGAVSGLLTYSLAGGGKVDVVLNGTGQTRVASGALTAMTSADFGNVSVGAGTVQRTFRFTNTGTKAATGLSASVGATAGLVMSANTCGTAASPVSVGAGSTCSITLQWTPTEAASLAGTQLAVSGDFTNSPASLELTGTAGGFSAAAQWSTSSAALTPPGASDTSFGAVSGGTTATKTLFAYNTGANGKQSVGFVLSGDTSQFKLTKLVSAGQTSCSGTSGAIAADGLSAQPCTANDIVTGTLASQIQFVVTYAPTEAGNHSITLTPSTNNGTSLPAPLQLTGYSGGTTPTLALSTSSVSVVALDATATTLSSTVNTAKTLNVYGLNIGGGTLAAGFTLSGDTSHFYINSLSRNGGSCISGGVVAANKLSATPCYALPGGLATSGTGVRGVFVFKPLASGTFRVTVTPTTDNGTVLPGSFELTGTAP